MHPTPRLPGERSRVGGAPRLQGERSRVGVRPGFKVSVLVWGCAPASRRACSCGGAPQLPGERSRGGVHRRHCRPFHHCFIVAIFITVSLSPFSSGGKMCCVCREFGSGYSGGEWKRGTDARRAFGGD